MLKFPLAAATDMENDAAGAPAGLGRIAYERFKDALFSGQISPGTFVSQAELVRILESPLGATREALALLQAEGLVTIKPRAGIAIAKPDFRMIRNSYQMRQFIERPAVRRLAETADAGLLGHIEAEHEAIARELHEQEVSRERMSALAVFDQAFHARTVAQLDNPLADRAYRQALEHSQLLRMEAIRGLTSPMMLRTLSEHLDIIRACRARDPDAAEAALVRHCEKAMQRAMGV